MWRSPYFWRCLVRTEVCALLLFGLASYLNGAPPPEDCSALCPTFYGFPEWFFVYGPRGFDVEWDTFFLYFGGVILISGVGVTLRHHAIRPLDKTWNAGLEPSLSKEWNSKEDDEDFREL